MHNLVPIIMSSASMSIDTVTYWLSRIMIHCMSAMSNHANTVESWSIAPERVGAF